MTNSISRLLEPSELEAILDRDNLLIIDLCNPALYQQKHVPGAIHLSGSLLMAGTAPTPGKLPSLQQLSKIISYLGISAETHVVVYDDEGGGWAGRMAWTLDLLGYSNWSYLNGGIVSWVKEGFPTQSEANQPVSQSIDAKLVNPAVRSDVDSITSKLEEADFAVWDARSPAEYRGDMVRSVRGGHIPGAINIEWTSLMDQQRNLRLREDAQDILDAAGLTQDKVITTHCQSHHRSAFTYMAARILGYNNISAYDGSWSEWGNLDSTPVELGS
jgi:thiosulfate/3-mercaptopyruvate sulfurtransferase